MQVLKIYIIYIKEVFNRYKTLQSVPPGGQLKNIFPFKRGTHHNLGQPRFLV